MTFTDLRHTLEPLGWRFDGLNLTSPSGGYWLCESELMRVSPIGVYGSIAQRREKSLGRAQEYQHLLLALEGDPEVSMLAAHMRTAAEIATPWALEHGAALSLWEFSRPLVRATARHPSGGIACIECEIHNSTAVSVTSLHWRDDHENRVRRSWIYAFATTELSAGSLQARLDEALRLLLESRDVTLCTSTILAGDDNLAVLSQAWENGFAVLR